MNQATAILLAVMTVASSALAGGPAQAVDARTVNSTVPLERCGLTRLYAPQGDEGVDAAEDFGDAYVVQVFHQGDAGGVGEAQVVIDCATGEAWSFAPGGPALMGPADLAAVQKASAYEQLGRFVRKSPRSYAAVAAWRRANELTLTDFGTILEGRIPLGTRGETYDLTCGCKLHNPASIGAR